MVLKYGQYIQIWFTQLIWKVGMLQVSDVTDDPDFDVAQHIKKIMDSSDQERNIMTLANVSFSYDAEHWWYWNMANISRFDSHSSFGRLGYAV